MSPEDSSVSLRRFTEADIPHLVEWNCGAKERELLRWAGPVFSVPLTERQVQRYVQHSHGQLFTIEVDKTPVGVIELGRVDPVHRNARIGKVLIGDVAFRGRGIAQKAINQVLYKAFVEDKLHKVSLSVLAENTQAVRCYLRCGFSQDARLREHRFVDSRWYDLLEMSLLESEYLSALGNKPRHDYTTSRLRVRSTTVDDVSQALAYYIRNRSFLSVYGPSRSPEFFTRHVQEQLIFEDIRREREGAGLRLWIELLEQPGHCIGNMSLSHIIRGNFQSAFLGYQLDEKHTGQGYMQEALQVMLSIAFKQLRLHRVEASIRPENTPSRRLAEKLGFREEGLGTSYLNINGRWVDHLRYTLLEDQWSE
ncbi:MAG: GNAT family N-acetyltransferase [Spirochaetota bacterium]